MAERPAWLVPGTNVAVVTQGGALSGTTVRFSTIDRVLKRDVVLANGDRFNADTLLRTGERVPWGPLVRLMLPDAPEVARALQAQEGRRRVSELRSVLDATTSRLRNAGEAGEKFPEILAGLRADLDRLEGDT